MKIYLETLGCQMNRLDSELAAGSLRRAGHELIDDRSSAEVVLYNTCSVRAHAEDKVFSRLGEDAVRTRVSGRRQIVGVLGCMAQRLGRSLRKRYPVVNIICGPGQLASLVKLIDAASAGKTVVALDRRRDDSLARGAETIDELDLARDALGGILPKAYVRVMRGCDKFCTYCIVPFVRGPEISRKPENIADETRRLVDLGASEITLLGQTVNSYQWSAGDRTVRFSDLLELLSPIAGLRRLRFVTSHPIDFGDDILEAMATLANVCPYIHCPAQSGSDAVLKRMNRKYTRRDYDDLVDRARATVPDVVLAGDFIVGFPGESNADHQASAELIRRSGYKNTFIFKYSPRPGTLAAKRLADDVAAEVKRLRNHELLAVQAEVGLAHHRGYVGETTEVLVTGPSPRSAKRPADDSQAVIQLAGRTTGDHVVVFDGPRNLTGHYVKTEIIGATSLTLLGRLATDERDP
ncbi:MAG: tRNA (N6-isopentenyl adenosine(37)-C2)-methylthiotransferase MiaB [Planctomycetes bacterium]|nr:tRNA (N6-isopentenyl adenosine(37)-C2)-methylthiotransferase MiaB [Planctomycetota bacterium]